MEKLNQNIPKRFYKNKMYYSKRCHRDESTQCVYRFRYFGFCWQFSRLDSSSWLDLEGEDNPKDILYGNEVFISEEEYEDLMLIQELKK